MKRFLSKEKTMTLSFTEFMELVKKLAHGVGYASGTVDEWFNQER